MMRMERATAADLPRIEALLAEAGLPIQGAALAFADGVVARAGNLVVAAAAIERYGSAGLLRSVVVAPGWRGSGLGRSAVRCAEALASRAGVRDLYLLTETAYDWFSRLGFALIDRELAAAAVGASVEFTTVCRDRGVAMHKALKSATQVDFEH